MSQQLVTIVGTRTPSVQLATDARQTVVYTPEVQRRVDYGYITITKWHDVPETEDALSGEDSLSSVDVPPRGGPEATREAWATFLGTLTPPVEFDAADPDVGRNDLIALYDEWISQQAATGE